MLLIESNKYFTPVCGWDRKGHYIRKLLVGFWNNIHKDFYTCSQQNFNIFIDDCIKFSKKLNPCSKNDIIILYICAIKTVLNDYDIVISPYCSQDAPPNKLVVLKILFKCQNVNNREE